MRRESGETKEIFAINIKTIKVVKKLMEMARKISWKIEDNKKILPYFWALIKLEKINRSTWFWIFKFSITKERKKPREIWKSTNCKQKRCVRAVSTAKSTGFFLSSRKDGVEVGKVGARGQSSEEGGKTSRGWVCVVQPLSFSYRTASYLLKKKKDKKSTETK